MERAITFINGGIKKCLFKPKMDRTMEAGAQIGRIVITV